MLEKQKQQKRTGSMQTRKRGVSALYVIGAALLSCAHITGVGAPFGVAFAAAGWAYDLVPIETFMRAHCDVYLPSVAALAQYVLPE